MTNFRNKEIEVSEKVLTIRADGHARALPSIYNKYIPAKYHQSANVFDVDVDALSAIAQDIGPSIAEIRGEA